MLRLRLLLHIAGTERRQDLWTVIVTDGGRMTHARAGAALPCCLASPWGAWGQFRGATRGSGVHPVELCWGQAVPVGGSWVALKSPGLQHVCQTQQLLLFNLSLATCRLDPSRLAESKWVWLLR